MLQIISKERTKAVKSATTYFNECFLRGLIRKKVWETKNHFGFPILVLFTKVLLLLFKDFFKTAKKIIEDKVL